MNFRDKCQECAERLLRESEQDGGSTPALNDTRLCAVCHVFDEEEDTIKRIPDNYVNNPTDFL